MPKKMTIICLAFLMTLVIIGPDFTWAGEPKEIKIGATLALSGRFKGIVGNFEKLGNEWAGLINERGGIYVKEYGKLLPVKFEIYDDASKAENARKFYEKWPPTPASLFSWGLFPALSPMRLLP